MNNPNIPMPHSPLDDLGIILTDEERKEVVDRVEQRAIETAEDNQPASLPSEELFDWSITLTEDQRVRLLKDLDAKAQQDAEDNHPASRPPIPGLRASRLLSRRNKR